MNRYKVTESDGFVKRVRADSVEVDRGVLLFKTSDEVVRAYSEDGWQKFSKQ
jgi:hypothetical protein